MTDDEQILEAIAQAFETLSERLKSLRTRSIKWPN
jgi:hypothetical protein